MNLNYINPIISLPDSVAIIGSSGSLAEHEYGAKIDEHECVIRFNRAPVEGFENIVGSRTDYRVVNNHVFRNNPIDTKFTHQPQDFIRSLKNSKIIHIGPAPLNKNIIERNVDESSEVFDFDYQKVDQLKSTVNFVSDNNPSVGLVIICLCIECGIVPSIFGFDTDISDSSRSHYWENRPAAGKYHKINYEKSFLKEQGNKGLVILNE